MAGAVAWPVATGGAGGAIGPGGFGGGPHRWRRHRRDGVPGGRWLRRRDPHALGAPLGRELRGGLVRRDGRSRWLHRRCGRVAAASAVAVAVGKAGAAADRAVAPAGRPGSRPGKPAAARAADHRCAIAWPSRMSTVGHPGAVDEDAVCGFCRWPPNGCRRTAAPHPARRRRRRGGDARALQRDVAPVGRSRRSRRGPGRRRISPIRPIRSTGRLGTRKPLSASTTLSSSPQIDSQCLPAWWSIHGDGPSQCVAAWCRCGIVEKPAQHLRPPPPAPGGPPARARPIAVRSRRRGRPERR